VIRPLISKATPVAVAALVLCTAPAKADCNARDFMIKEVQDIQRSGETELSFVLTATEEEFNNAKKNAGLSGAYGLISGSANYGEAQEKARRIAQSTKFDYKSSYASSYFSQSLSPKALDAYVACLERDKERPGLTVWLQGRQGDFFTFRAFWVGSDVSLPSAKWDSEPLVDGGTVTSKPTTWLKAKTEEIVIKRPTNVDLFLNLKVGGEVKSMVIVKDPPAVAWVQKPVISGVLMKASTHGPNPGCSAGETADCVVPTHPGGSFVLKSASLTERSSSDPTKYSEAFSESPDKVCAKMTQSTGCCECAQSAQGRLMAIEKYPQVAE
jgi:hypothetical protein